MVYLSPSECLPLHDALSTGYKRAGVYPLASAILTLAHEAVHLRGITYEGVTECTALPLVTDLAVRYFAIPAVITQTTRRIVQRWVWRKVNGTRKRVRVAVTVLTRADVANPDIALIGETALALHRGRSVEYQGNC